MTPDFQLAFQDGATTITPFGEVKLSCFHHVGVLLLPTGKIVACDPLTICDPLPFTVQVPPGRYPVVLSIAHFDSDQRVAFAKVKFSSQRPVSWEMALLGDQDVGELKAGQTFGYPVDSGTGCFMDARAARSLLKKMERDEDYWQRITDELEETYVHTWGWANMVMDRSTGANLTAFSSGFGDGVYASYFGIDEAGQAACLLTDFGIVRSSEE